MSRQTYSSIIFSSGIKPVFIGFFNALNITKLSYTIDESNLSHENFDTTTEGELISANMSISVAGTNYEVGDNIQLTSTGHGAVINVTGVDGAGGVTSFSLKFGGMHYADNDVFNGSTNTLSSDSKNGKNLEINAGTVSTDSVNIDTVSENLIAKTINVRTYLRAFNKAGTDAEFETAVNNLDQLGADWIVGITRAIDSICLAFPDMPQQDDDTTLLTTTSSTSLNSAFVNTASEDTKGAIFIKSEALRKFALYSSQSINRNHTSLVYTGKSPISVFLQEYITPINTAFATFCNEVERFVKEVDLLLTLLKLGTFVNDDNVSNLKQARTDILATLADIETGLVNFKNVANA